LESSEKLTILKIPARPGKNIFCLKQYAHIFRLRRSAVQPEKMST
jgi:hypothetical protein